jgi:hypothetical protein
LLGLAVGLVYLIEHSSLAEMHGVGLRLACEYLFDRDRAYDWKVWDSDFLTFSRVWTPEIDAHGTHGCVASCALDSL